MYDIKHIQKGCLRIKLTFNTQIYIGYGMKISGVTSTPRSLSLGGSFDRFLILLQNDKSMRPNPYQITQNHTKKDPIGKT